MKTYGKARFDGKKMHFDAIGWAMIKAVAKRTKQSPTKVVNSALTRYARSLNGKATKKS